MKMKNGESVSLLGLLGMSRRRHIKTFDIGARWKVL